MEQELERGARPRQIDIVTDVEIPPDPVVSIGGDICAEELFRLYKGHSNAISAEVLFGVLGEGAFTDRLESRGIFLLFNTLHDALESISEVVIV